MTFKLSQVVANRVTKDLMELTNGTDEGGVFVPTEGKVLRVVGFRTLPDGAERFAVAYAYIKVNPADLFECGADEAFNGAAALVNAGRI